MSDNISHPSPDQTPLYRGTLRVPGGRRSVSLYPEGHLRSSTVVRREAPEVVKVCVGVGAVIIGVLWPAVAYMLRGSSLSPFIAGTIIAVMGVALLVKALFSHENITTSSGLDQQTVETFAHIPSSGAITRLLADLHDVSVAESRANSAAEAAAARGQIAPDLRHLPRIEARAREEAAAARRTKTQTCSTLVGIALSREESGSQK